MALALKKENMTVLAINKRKKEIIVVSDSRYSFDVVSMRGDSSEKIFLDNGPKIFKLNTKIVSSLNEKMESSILYQGSIGIAFAGNVNFMQTYKSRLEWVMEYLQVSPLNKKRYSDIIVDIAFEEYKDLYESTCDKYMDDTDVCFFIKNSETNDLESYLFSVVFEDGMENPEARKQLVANDISFYGSGKEWAQTKFDILRQNRGLPGNILQLMKMIVKDLEKQSNSDVGGDLQCGRLDESGFEVVGVLDYDETSFSAPFHYCFGGTRMHENDKYGSGVNVTRGFLEVYNEKELEEKNNEEFKRSMQSIFGENWSNDCNMWDVQ